MAPSPHEGHRLRVDAQLPLFDLSHENTPYDIWEALTG